MNNNIRLQKTERDCPTNKKIRSGHKGGRLIWDYAVIIDGEHRAWWWRIANRNAYQLHDIDHHVIRSSPHWWSTIECPGIGHLAACTQRAMSYIPTLSYLMALREQESADSIAQERAIREQQHRYRLEQAAPRLLEIIQLIHEEIQHQQYDETPITELRNRVEQVIRELGLEEGGEGEAK